MIPVKLLSAPSASGYEKLEAFNQSKLELQKVMFKTAHIINKRTRMSPASNGREDKDESMFNNI